MRVISRFASLSLVLFLFVPEQAVTAQAVPAPASVTRPYPDPGPTVWLSPNTASVDMLQMFTAPNTWDTARARIDVFLFDDGQLGTGGWSCTAQPWYNCGDNHLSSFVAVNAFRKLRRWGVDLASMATFAGPIESLQPLVCTSDAKAFALTVNGSANVVQNVEANGGEVAYLALDEPLRQWLPEYYYTWSGLQDPRPCLVDTPDDVADLMADYLEFMANWAPTVRIGQVELYPEVGVQQLKQWVLALEQRGVTLPFLHLDVHGKRLDNYVAWGLPVDFAKDMAELEAFLAQHGTEFGIIYTDVDWDAQAWPPSVYDDAFYYTRTLNWVSEVSAAGIVPDHALFMSWVGPVYTTGPSPNEIPFNLPDDDPSLPSHTRLVLAGMKQMGF